jgi:hypothetical protein
MSRRREHLEELANLPKAHNTFSASTTRLSPFIHVEEEPLSAFGSLSHHTRTSNATTNSKQIASPLERLGERSLSPSISRRSDETFIRNGRNAQMPSAGLSVNPIKPPRPVADQFRNASSRKPKQPPPKDAVSEPQRSTDSTVRMVKTRRRDWGYPVSWECCKCVSLNIYIYEESTGNVAEASCPGCRVHSVCFNCEDLWDRGRWDPVEPRERQPLFTLARPPGAYRPMRDEYGFTPLHPACTRGKLTVVQDRWPSAPEDLEVEDDAGETPLYVATWAGSSEVVDFLLSKGAKIDADNSQPDLSPFIVAAEFGKIDFIKLFLRHGADPTWQYEDGKTAYNYIPKDHPNSHTIRQLFDDAIAERASQKPKISNAFEKHLKQEMYMHYTISTDRSGTDDDVKTAILSVLAEKEKKIDPTNSFADIDNRGTRGLPFRAQLFP